MASRHHHAEFSPFEFQPGGYDHHHAREMRSIYGVPGNSPYFKHFQGGPHPRFHPNGPHIDFGPPNYGMFQPPMSPYGSDHNGGRRHRRHYNVPEYQSDDTGRHRGRRSHDRSRLDPPRVRDRSRPNLPDGPRVDDHSEELGETEGARQEFHEALKGYQSLTGSPEMTRQGISDALAKDELLEASAEGKLKPAIRGDLQFIGQNWDKFKGFTKDKAGETISLESADQAFDERRDSITNGRTTRTRRDAAIDNVGPPRRNGDIRPPADDPYGDNPYYKTHLRPDESFPTDIEDGAAFMNTFLHGVKNRAATLGTVGQCGQGVREGGNSSDPRMRLIGDPKNQRFFRTATELGQLFQNQGWTKIPLNSLTAEQRENLPTALIVRPWSFNPNGAGDIAVKEHRGKQYNDHAQGFDYGSSRYMGSYALLPPSHPYALRYRDETSAIAGNS
jgi:hypothetical protein